MDDLVVSAEICEDVWSPIPPSIEAAREGAIILVNCSASDETIGKDSYREELIKGQSARLIAGYVYAKCRGRRVYNGCGIWRTQYYCREWDDPERSKAVCQRDDRQRD